METLSKVYRLSLSCNQNVAKADWSTMADMLRTRIANRDAKMIIQLSILCNQ